MLIKSKILVTTFVTLLLTAILILLFVGWQLNVSVNRQTKVLQEDLVSDVQKHAVAEVRFLQELMNTHDHRLALNVKTVLTSDTVIEHIRRGQDVALRGQILEIFSRMNADFLVVFDKYERVVAIAPDLDQLSVKPETLLQSPHMQALQKKVRAGNLAENEIEIGYWQWGTAEQDPTRLLNGEEKRRGGILKLAAAVILNDYKDEVVGYVLAGKFMGRFQEIMDNAYEITGVASIIYWKRIPLVWSGFDKDDAAMQTKSLLLDKDIDQRLAVTHGYIHDRSVLAGEKYYVTLAPILDYKGAKIGALLVGEPERVVVEASNNLQQQGQQTRNRILFALSLIGVLALGVSTIVQWFSAINLSKPIIKCMEFVKEVSGGNLDASLQVEGNDEIGQLAQAMHHMIRNIKSVQKGVQQEVQKDLTETVEQLASLACTMDSMSAHISEESGSMVAASKQVSDTMKAIAESASISQHNMSSVTSAAAQMSSTVMDISKNTSKAHSISEAAVGSVEKTSESMKMLNRASKDIGSVLDAIEEIADQIELLALNAKIEASRAGEAGKGFGVVANEIKELSKQANEATDEIRKKITGMQESTSNSMDSISLVSGVIREVNDIVSIIASAVEEQTVSAEYIVGNIGMASEEIKGVASSVNEAAGAADRMALGISNVGKNIDEVQKTANQLHNVTKLLNGVGQDLLKMVARFG